MPNINAPRGFVPLRHMDGSPYNGQVTLMLLPSGDGNAVFIGDVVKWGGSAGTAGQVVSGWDVEGVPTAASIAATTTVSAGTSIAGVVRGFVPDYSNLNTRYRTASTARLVWVITDPTVIYEIQEDATSAFAATDIGLNAQFTTGTGNTTTGISGSKVMNGGKATTNTLPLRLVGLVKRPDNAFATASDPAKFEVFFNSSAMVAGADTAATGT